MNHYTCTPEYAALMAKYNQWMNEQLYKICTRLTDKERKSDRGIYFRSIHGTLNHLLYGDRSWMGRFLGAPFSVTNLGQELYSHFGQLREERRLTDNEILHWAENVTQDWLNSAFTYTSNVDGVTRTLAAGTLVIHFFNHQTHHRGQITALLDQAGHDHGVTDIPWMPALYDSSEAISSA